MKLDRVTITGADDSISPHELVALSALYPYVEWAILVSRSQAGSPRFPSLDWIHSLQNITTPNMKLSMHICGSWMRDLLEGRNSIPTSLLRGNFQRAQLNFHAEPQMLRLRPCIDALASLGIPEIIFQVDGNEGLQILSLVHGEMPTFRCVPLFDMSHGAGVLADAWPEPFNETTYHGYAGGLGPDNLAEQIPLIGKAAGETPIWIDMETRVRSDNDKQFDLTLVEQCLLIARPFVTT